jgi:hypothetical protein
MDLSSLQEAKLFRRITFDKSFLSLTTKFFVMILYTQLHNEIGLKSSSLLACPFLGSRERKVELKVGKTSTCHSDLLNHYEKIFTKTNKKIQ